MSVFITTGALKRCVPAAALLLLAALSAATGPSRKLTQGTGDASGPTYLWVVDYSDNPNRAVGWADDDEGVHADKNVSVFRPPQEGGVWYTGYFPVGSHTDMLPQGKRVTLLAVTGGGHIGDAGFPLSNPIGWESKWSTSQQGCTFLMQMPQCPAGYVALGGCFQRQETSSFGLVDIPDIDIAGVVGDIAGGVSGVVDPGSLVGGTDGPIQSGTPTTDPDTAGTINLVCVRDDLVVPVGAVEVWNDKGSDAQGDGSIWTATDTDGGFAPGSMIAQSGYDQPRAYAFKRGAVIIG